MRVKQLPIPQRSYLPQELASWTSMIMLWLGNLERKLKWSTWKYLRRHPSRKSKWWRPLTKSINQQSTRTSTVTSNSTITSRLCWLGTPRLRWHQPQWTYRLVHGTNLKITLVWLTSVNTCYSRAQRPSQRSDNLMISWVVPEDSVMHTQRPPIPTTTSKWDQDNS